MGCDWYANGNEDIVINVYDHEKGIKIAEFVIPKHKLDHDMPLSLDVLGVTWR